MAERPPQNVRTDKSQRVPALVGEEEAQLTSPAKRRLQLSVSDHSVWGWRGGLMAWSTGCSDGDLGSSPTTHTVAHKHFSVADPLLASVGITLT